MLDNHRTVRAPDGSLILISRDGLQTKSAGRSVSPERKPTGDGLRCDNPTQVGAKIDPSQYGAKIDPSQLGAKIDPAQCGAKIDPTQCGAKIQPTA